jgi:hypothetical protein
LSIKSVTTAPALEQRATAFDDIMQRFARDEHGVMCANICFEPLRSLQPGDIASCQRLGESTSCENMCAYEDSGMTTGAYLAAQSLRYRLTNDPAAKQAADDAFAGICFVYELGAKGKSPGFFPKPYGAVISNQISRDQYLFVMSGLAEYLKIASADSAEQIVGMIAHMADYWISINYSTSYFGLPTSSHLDDYMGSLFLGIIGIAARVTGEARFQREYQRLFSEALLGPRMPETLLAQFRRGELYDGATYFRQAENPIMMKSMAIDFLWETEPGDRDLWRQALQAYWEEDLRVSLDENTGLNHFIVGYDTKADTTFLTEPGVVDEIQNPLGLSVLNWGGRRQSAGSTQTAFAAAIIADRLGLSDAADTMSLILSKLTLESFRGLTVPDHRHIPPEHEFEVTLLNSAYLSYWLWTYWLARERSLISS